MGTIKSFKKFIKESIWSDIQDRSSGDVVRKEDDVNNLDLNEFYAYIKDQYKTKVEYIDLDAMGGGNGDVLGVDITENIILFYKPKRGHILLSWSRVKIPMPFFDELTDRFKIENPNAMRRIITEKDGSCTNKTFVDVIDFFIGHKESMMNESIWSDIQDRSTGETTRKEDDVNLLDKDGLYEYLISHYKPVEGIDIKSYIFCGNSYINLCVFTYPTETRYSILLDILNCRVKVRTPYIKRWPANLLDMIYKKYNREDVIDKNRDHMTFITPKEGKGNNQFYIDFLDMILNNVDKPLLKKVINESIWSDIQDRSSGETVREEDITEEDKKEIDYIFNGFAYLIVYTDYKPTIDDFIKMMKEAYPDFEKDNSKYIAWVRSNWDKKYKDELDKKIQDNKKDVDKRINKYLNNFVGQVVYCEKYNVSLPDIKKFSDEILKHCGIPIEMRFVGKIRVDESWLDIFKKYVDENWNDVKKRINDLIVEENQKIAKTGFKKTPGKKICDILDEWWDSLGDEKDDIAWDEFGERAEEKYYERHNPKYNEYTGEDFDADEEWSNASWIESVEIYMKYNQKANESIWSDIQDRSGGETVRKEDERHKILERLLATYIKLFAESCYYHSEYTSGSYPDFRAYIKDFRDNPRIEEVCPDDSYFDDLLNYVNKETWNNQIDDTIMEMTNRLYKGEHLITDDVIEELRKHNVNESIWSDIQDRSSGETVRKEDVPLTDDELKELDQYITDYGNEVVLGWGRGSDACNLDEFIDYLKTDRKVDDRILKYVKDNWFDEICDGVDASIEQTQEEWHQDMNESIWSDIQDRSTGDTVRKEDEVLTDMEINSLNEFTLMYCRRERAHYIQNHIVPPPPSRRKENDYEGLIKYIEDRRDENLFTNVGDYDKIIKYIKKNWDKLDMDTYIKKWICSPDVMKGTKIVECDGVPGGLTPADVGGMGPAYFPGPNGEPGSGDLPSPTGIVYKQVAPFDTFIKMRKPKKNKKKKFRKEDEPCVHSPNAKVYDYVDDFRDYVDRTYNNIDKRR